MGAVRCASSCNFPNPILQAFGRLVGWWILPTNTALLGFGQTLPSGVLLPQSPFHPHKSRIEPDQRPHTESHEQKAPRSTDSGPVQIFNLSVLRRTVSQKWESRAVQSRTDPNSRRPMPVGSTAARWTMLRYSLAPSVVYGREGQAPALSAMPAETLLE